LRLLLRTTAASHFITALAEGGELDEEDIQYLEDHPEEVEEMDTYRIYMGEYVKDAMRQAIDQFLANRAGEIEDHFADEFDGDEAKVQKMVAQVEKNPLWEVPRISSFYEFVEDAFELDVDAIQPPRQSIEKLVASYEKANSGRTGKDEE
jgi:hypothetical protein